MNQETSNGEASPSRTRFSLKSLLLLAFVVALCLGSYRYGHQVGYVEGDRSGFAAGLNAKFYLVTYRVGDLVGPDHPFKDLGSLTREITLRIQPESWNDREGLGVIGESPANASIVVSQTDRAHDDITAFLERIRTRRGPVKDVQTATATE